MYAKRFRLNKARDLVTFIYHHYKVYFFIKPREQID